MVKIFNILEGLFPKEEKKDNSGLYKALEEEQTKRANEKPDLNNNRLLK